MSTPHISLSPIPLSFLPSPLSLSLSYTPTHTLILAAAVARQYLHPGCLLDSQHTAAKLALTHPLQLLFAELEVDNWGRRGEAVLSEGR